MDTHDLLGSALHLTFKVNPVPVSDPAHRAGLPPNIWKTHTFQAPETRKDWTPSDNSHQPLGAHHDLI